MSEEHHKKRKEVLPTAEERLQWFELYKRIGKVPPVCEQYGISRKTFYKWWKIYTKNNGSFEVLQNRSRRPHSNPRSTPEHIVQRLKMLREQTGFGQKRLQLYLSIWYGIDLAENTIWKILRRSGVDMKGTKSKKRKIKLSEALFPGDRIIVYVKQFVHPVGGQTYWYYAATDECTHLRVGKIYPRHSTLSALDFVQHIIMAFPFPIHFIHTPLDNAFTSVTMARSKTHAFTQNLRRLGIKQYVPTRRKFASQLYYKRIKSFDAPDGFLALQYNQFADVERTLRNMLSDYNNNQPRKEIELQTPLQKLRQFEQFKSLEHFEAWWKL
jgi:transposase